MKFVSFLGCATNKAAGIVYLPDKTGTHRPYELTPISGVNSEAGLTEFRLKNLNSGEVLSAERTKENTGGIIETAKWQIQARWEEDDDEEMTTDTLEVFVVD